MNVITKETATVYRGGGKRYFTKKAAYNAAARAKIKTRCDCESPMLADFETGYLPVCCKYHEDADRLAKLQARLARWYKYQDSKVERRD